VGVRLQPLGVFLVYAGRQLLLFPTALRSPWIEAVVDLIRQWRSG
jgi:hypothetical protein